MSSSSSCSSPTSTSLTTTASEVAVSCDDAKVELEVAFDVPRAVRWRLLTTCVLFLPLLALLVLAMVLNGASDHKKTLDQDFLLDDQRPPKNADSSNSQVFWIVLIAVDIVAAIGFFAWGVVSARNQQCIVTASELIVTIPGHGSGSWGFGKTTKRIGLHQIRDVTIAKTWCCSGSQSLVIDDSTFRRVPHGLRWIEVPTVVFVFVQDMHQVQKVILAKRNEVLDLHRRLATRSMNRLSTIIL